MREEHIQNAVSFLQDPQVANADLESRISFLKSKSLTEEEIQEALKRAQQSPAPAPAAPSAGVASTVGVPSRAAFPTSYMMQPPPVPKRDWKDYFVMATVSVGVAYGLYEVTKRYILPMILPPTPASLEADKEALEQEFARMEALVEQVQQDTQEMRDSERQRQDEYTKLMEEAQNVVNTLKRQGDERKTDIKSLKSHVEALREMMPKYLDKYREKQDDVIKELQAEVKSLKYLVSNRVKSGGAGSGVPPASMVPSSVNLSRSAEPFIPDPAARATASAPSASTNGIPPVAAVPAAVSAGAPSIPGVSTVPAHAGNGPLSASVESEKSAGIPAWQLAAQNSE